MARVTEFVAAVPDGRRRRNADCDAAARIRRLPGGCVVPVDPDPQAAEGRPVHAPPLVARREPRVLALPDQRQLPGRARLRLRPAGDAQRLGRFPDHLQRVLRHRPPHRWSGGSSSRMRRVCRCRDRSGPMTRRARRRARKPPRALPHLPRHRPPHRSQRRTPDQRARRGLGRVATHRRDRGRAARADPLAGRAPAARRLVLPHPRRARHEHADLLHHLLRDGGAGLREHGATRRAELGAEDIVGGLRR